MWCHFGLHCRLLLPIVAPHGGHCCIYSILLGFRRPGGAQMESRRQGRSTSGNQVNLHIAHENDDFMLCF